MIRKIIFSFHIIILIFSCSKEQIKEVDLNQDKGKDIYKEAVIEMNKGEFFYASKLFSEAELNLLDVKFSSKAAILSGYCLYRINFYDESLDKINRFLKRYPADSNVPYAHYLSAIISFEQISDEKKDLKPVLETKNKIISYLKQYPDTEYAIDLKFKLNLVNNQLAAKEIYVARYYMQTQKWIAAINRLKTVVEKYDETIFVEEALHRLVEIYYKVGLIEEANKTAKILGYNYNSSEWYKKSYSILNKNYKIQLDKPKKDDGLIKKVLEKILS